MATVDQTPATRGDLADLREELRAHYATKADLAQLEARLVKWMVGTMLAAAGIAATIALVVQRLLG